MKVFFRYRRTVMVWFLCLFLLGGCKSSASVLTSEDLPADEIQREKEEVSSGKTEKDQETEWIYVDVCGAVRTPGVYKLPAGSRIFQAIEMAGGISGEAMVESVNQAGILEDGQQIRIYTKKEAEEFNKEQALTEKNSTLPGGEKGKVNINQADKSALMTLTGIGETRAEAILAYREANGGFSAIEDLMQVEGIKAKTYEKLKDEITVN